MQITFLTFVIVFLIVAVGYQSYMHINLEQKLLAAESKAKELQRELSTCACDCEGVRDWYQTQCELEVPSEWENIKEGGRVSPSSVSEAFNPETDHKDSIDASAERYVPPELGELTGHAERDRLREYHRTFKEGHIAYNPACDLADPVPPAPVVARPPEGVLLFVNSFQQLEDDDTVVVVVRWYCPLWQGKPANLEIVDHDGNVLASLDHPTPEGQVRIVPGRSGPLPLQISLLDGDDEVMATRAINLYVATPVELQTGQCWRQRHTRLSRTNTLGNSCPFDPKNYDDWPRQPSLCEYMSLECRQANHMFGVPGYTVGLSIFGFSRADFSFIDFIFAARTSLLHATEIGTGGGLVSIFLSTTVAIRGGQLRSFDIKDCRGEGIMRAWNTKHAKFTALNTFEGPDMAHPEVVDAVKRPNTLNLFDGGSKMFEVGAFGHHIDTSSIFLIHDWEDETFEEGFEETLYEIGFDRIYWDFAEQLGSGEPASISQQTRMFMQISA